MGSSVAREMTGTIGIKIAALLDRISEMQSTAALQNDEQKEQSRVVSFTLYLATNPLLTNLHRKMSTTVLAGKPFTRAQ